MKPLLGILCAALVLSTATAVLGGAHATPQAAVGPAAGARIPHDLTARDQYGQERNFKSLAHRRGLVIMFTRSLEW